METKDKFSETVQKFKIFFQKLTTKIEEKERILDACEHHLEDILVKTQNFRGVIKKKIELQYIVFSTLRALFISDETFKKTFIEFLRHQMSLENLKAQKKIIFNLQQNQSIFKNFNILNEKEFERLFDFTSPWRFDFEVSKNDNKQKISEFITRHQNSKRQTSMETSAQNSVYNWHNKLRGATLENKTLNLFYKPMKTIDTENNTLNQTQSRRGVSNNSIRISSYGKKKEKKSSNNSALEKTNRKRPRISNAEIDSSNQNNTNVDSNMHQTNYANKNTPSFFLRKITIERSQKDNKISAKSIQTANDLQLLKDLNFLGIELSNSKELINSTNRLILNYLTNELIVKIFVSVNQTASQVSLNAFLKKHNELKVTVTQLYKHYIFYKNLFDQKVVFYNTLLENREILKKESIVAEEKGLIDIDETTKTLTEKYQVAHLKFELKFKQAISHQSVLKEVSFWIQNLKSANKIDHKIMIVDAISVEERFKIVSSDIYNKIKNAEKKFTKKIFKFNTLI